LRGGGAAPQRRLRGRRAGRRRGVRAPRDGPALRRGLLGRERDAAGAAARPRDGDRRVDRPRRRTEPVVSRLESDYYAFMGYDPEGSRAGLRHYLPWFAGGPVLELACGRGEF